jgi:hypothetical protein
MRDQVQPGLHCPALVHRFLRAYAYVPWGYIGHMCVLQCGQEQTEQLRVLDAYRCNLSVRAKMPQQHRGARTYPDQSLTRLVFTRVCEVSSPPTMSTSWFLKKDSRIHRYAHTNHTVGDSTYPCIIEQRLVQQSAHQFRQ